MGKSLGESFGRSRWDIESFQGSQGFPEEGAPSFGPGGVLRNEKMGKGFQGIWISNGSRAQRGEAQEVKCIEGAWDPRGGFHAPLYFRFETWKRTAKGNTKEAKAVPPPPPPWFPPLESLFRGAPSARSEERRV